MGRDERSPQLILWLCLLLAWVVMLLLIDPRGEFPLNDDWAYARAVKTLHDEGQLELPSNWASMTLVAHVVWGWLITMPFGFSFFVLRMWNLVPALAGILGVFVLLRAASVSRPAAFVATAATAFNPVYAQLSVSFMTDISFFATAIWSAIYFLRALRDDAKTAFWIGLALSLTATMIRQHGVFLALAWAVVYVRRRGWQGSHLVLALLPLAAHLAYLGLHQLTLGSVAGAAYLYEDVQTRSAAVDREGWGYLLTKIFLRGEAVIIFASVLTLPIWLYALLARTKRDFWSARRGCLMIVWGAIAALVPLLWRPYIPYSVNIIYDLGVGPALLRDTYILGLPNLPTAPRAFWILLTAAGLLGGGLLAARWFELFPKAWRNTDANRHFSDAVLFFTVFSAGCLALLAILPLYDRYMILFLPLLFLVAAPRASAAPTHRISSIAATVAIFMIASFSTAGLHDYFAWNRARWSAIEWLTKEKGISPYQMDGGVEFHGWTTYEPNYDSPEGKSWWWVKDDEYVVAFGTIPGYEEISSYPYRAWLLPGKRAIHVLHRLNNP